MKTPAPRKLKSGTWFIQLRLNGRSVPVSASTAKECTRQAALIKAEHQSGKRTAKREDDNITLRKAIDAYIAKKSNLLSPSTIRGYTRIRETRFKDYVDLPMSKVDWAAACNAEAKLCEGKTLKNAWGLVAAVYRFNKLPVPDVTLAPVVPNEHPWLSPEEIKTFVAEVSETRFVIPAFLALSSLRCSEIAAVTWDRIDLKKKTITVKGARVYDKNHKLVEKKENKNRSSQRVVPIMIPELLAALQAVDDKTGYVIKQAPNTLYKQVNRLCAALGLPQVGTHGLRHSFASLGYHLGMSEREVMAIGGWADYNVMHKIYIHLAELDKVQAANKMASFYAKEEVNANENANEPAQPSNTNDLTA